MVGKIDAKTKQAQKRVKLLKMHFNDYPDVHQKAIMETLYNLLKNKTEKGCAMDDKSHSFMPPDDCLTTVNCQTQKLFNN